MKVIRDQQSALKSGLLQILFPERVENTEIKHESRKETTVKASRADTMESFNVFGQNSASRSTPNSQRGDILGVPVKNPRISFGV